MSIDDSEGNDITGTYVKRRFVPHDAWKLYARPVVGGEIEIPYEEEHLKWAELQTPPNTSIIYKKDIIWSEVTKDGKIINYKYFGCFPICLDPKRGFTTVSYAYKKPIVKDEK
jgi:hypothetical protein